MQLQLHDAGGDFGVGDTEGLEARCQASSKGFGDGFLGAPEAQHPLVAEAGVQGSQHLAFLFGEGDDFEAVALLREALDVDAEQMILIQGGHGDGGAAAMGDGDHWGNSQAGGPGAGDTRAAMLVRENFDVGGAEALVQMLFDQHADGVLGGTASQQPFLAALVDGLHGLPVCALARSEDEVGQDL